ncbi:prolyl oligopeptidase family serine peptidase [Sphingosinicella sp. LHD-64]|uniref:S9 family peptidase n=1 Tax=Sphingosinicella sp. LHD-64 TaxID=3072139 RepID=UPI00280DD97C|nr:prolyl oligopeptidase family serine peptidase [Sphingosinicella sp. LHD-64]MDQ8755146.1 prolyl oligopeptidase family serine peptidase [Sphingosinicella sp. LHD-64]
MIRPVLLCALLALAPLPVLAQPQAVQTRQIGTARLENVPEIPAEVRTAVQRYQNYREARFQDWLPDGSMLITTRFGTTAQVHRVAAPGTARTQLTFYDEPIAGAQTVPGTNHFLFGRDTGGDEWFQLYARAVEGGAAGQLTEPGTRNQSPTFSRDGRLLAWSRASRGSADYAIMIADPQDPSTRRVAWQGTGAVGPVDISADNSRILIARGLSNRETRLMILDLATGQVQELAWSAATPARYEEPRFVRDGRAILAITDAGSDVRRLVEIDIATGERRPVSPESRWDVEDYDLSDDGRALAYAMNEDGFSRVVVQDFVTRRALPQPEALPRGVLTGLEFSPDGQKLAIGMTTATSAGDVWTFDLTGRDGLERWTMSELGDLDPAQLASPELIRFESFDRLSVPAFVYRPRNVLAGTRTPVIIDIHGGPEAQTRPGWNPGAQYFADVLGATVILPNVRGSDGYGTRYLNLDNAEKREDSVRDIGALLDWIGRQPNLDPARVAVYGQSYGGYMSLAVMTHYSDRLVGGVERYGISNWISFLENTEAYRRDNRRAEYGDERNPQMRAVFERISPLANIRRIGRPMLVMQGANDPRVPQSESDQVVRDLRANGVETWYVLFADEGHGFQKKHNNDLRREVETVFLRRLFEAP